MSSGSKVIIRKRKTFGCYDLDLDLMTFTSEHDLDAVVTYLHAKNLVNRSNGSKVIIQIHTFGCCDIDLDPITFTSEHNLDMTVTSLHAKN